MLLAWSRIQYYLAAERRQPEPEIPLPPQARPFSTVISLLLKSLNNLLSISDDRTYRQRCHRCWHPLLGSGLSIPSCYLQDRKKELRINPAAPRISFWAPCLHPVTGKVLHFLFLPLLLCLLSPGNKVCLQDRQSHSLYPT